jgi:hypothetical protein
MKKTIIAFLMIVAVNSTLSAQHSKVKNADQFRRSFTKNFPGATITFWETMDEFIVVRFYLNDIKHEAWFEEDAALYAVAKYITIGHLPAKVSAAIKQNYRTDDAVSALEITKSNGRHYYAVKISDKNSIRTIRASPNGKIDVVKNEIL